MFVVNMLRGAIPIYYYFILLLLLLFQFIQYSRKAHTHTNTRRHTLLLIESLCMQMCISTMEIKYINNNNNLHGNIFLTSSKVYMHVYMQKVKLDVFTFNNNNKIPFVNMRMHRTRIGQLDPSKDRFCLMYIIEP